MEPAGILMQRYAGEEEDDEMAGTSGHVIIELRNVHDKEGYEALSALAEAASDPKSAVVSLDLDNSLGDVTVKGNCNVIIPLSSEVGEQRAILIKGGQGQLGRITTINRPLIGEFIQQQPEQEQQAKVAFCQKSEPFCSETPHTAILALILGSREGEGVERRGRAEESLSLSFRSNSTVKVTQQGQGSGTTTTTKEQHLLSPPLPSNRRMQPIPLHPTASSYFTHYTSSSLSPRHSPYASPSFSARSVPIPLRSARTTSNSSLERQSFAMSPYSPSTPPGSARPVHSSDNSPSSGSGGKTPIASPPMSLSKRRRAPDWPSPRTNSRQTDAAGSGVSRPGVTPSTAMTRDLSQTMHTPAVLRVPPTPVYSPAFYRSGLTTQPPPRPEPLHPRHTPFNSAPPLTASRLEHPRPPSPIGQGKKGKSQYWHDPSSSDVRILVLIPRSRLPRHSASFSSSSHQPLSHPQSAKPDSAQSFHSNQPEHAVWPITPQNTTVPAGNNEDQGLLGHIQSERGKGKRRGSLPGNDDIVALVFPLHQDYLLTQSSLFRQLLSPSSAHIDTPKPIKGARLLPTPPGSPPAIYLPLPDPPSFSVLVHWLYWGDTTALESALSKGLVEWQGVVKNVHQLGMDDGVKRVLGRWWRKWIKTDEGRARSRGGAGGGMGGAGMGEDSDEEEQLDDQEEETEEEEGRGMQVDRERSREGDDGGVSGLLRAL